MEKSKRDLESLVISQKEQLNRYETRLKDVVIAYKGLLKEKEALEASLSALTGGGSKDKLNDNDRNSRTSPSSSSASATTTTTSTTSKKKTPTNQNDGKSTNSDNDNLQIQIATLMNSLATLSAEKSRMEASFQADKKQLRNDIAQKDKTISELLEKIKELQKQNQIELENLKSKLIVERHEREKESNNHMIMIRELQKLYSDERHIKENLEMQLNDLKNQFSSANSTDGKVKDIINELKETKDKLKRYEKENQSQQEQQEQDSSLILLQLQNEMQNLKQQHAIALKTEQKRALMAEERNKKLAALHEDRVANLEARLAELSSTVGTYDRLRQQDQENIQKLKEKIIRLASSSNNDTNSANKDENSVKRDKVRDIKKIVEDIMHLKKQLLIENEKSHNSIDINKIFNVSTDHSECNEDYNKLHNENETLRLENIDLKQALDVQKNHIKTLQDKVKVLNRNIDEQELEIKTQTERLNQAIKTEKSKWKDMINRMENDYRSKLNTLELQLQKQRVRSLQLLDDKENEIKALKTSFEIFTAPPPPPPPQQQQQTGDQELFDGNQEETQQASTIKTKRHSMTLSHFGNILSSNGNNGSGGTGGANSITSTIGEHSPMLHYINELARKDVEISALRKAKYTAETTLRQALQDKVASQEELNDKILQLEEQVDRLERCKTREGANLEYLKNVVISFLSTSNIEGKRHMVNAIGAVLQFTPAEMKAINSLFPRK